MRAPRSHERRKERATLLATLYGVTIVQLTDTHIFSEGGRQWIFFDTAAYLGRCVAAINAMRPRPELVVVTGDVTNDGRPEQAARARALLDRLLVPYFVIPGNHDRAEALEAAFGPHVRRSPDAGLSYVIEAFPVRAIMFDSTRAGWPGGDVDDAKRAWLAERLAADVVRPTLLCMHHPPFEPSVPWLDRFRFRGAEALAAIVARHPNVVRVASGHVHHAFHASWAGTEASTAMSTSPQLFPRWAAPLGLAIDRERPGMHVHRFRDGRCVTEAAYVA